MLQVCRRSKLGGPQVLAAWIGYVPRRPADDTEPGRRPGCHCSRLLTEPRDERAEHGQIRAAPGAAIEAYRAALTIEPSPTFVQKIAVGSMAMD